jgi:hypothetical protein
MIPGEGGRGGRYEGRGEACTTREEAGGLARSCPSTPCDQLAAPIYMPPTTWVLVAHLAVLFPIDQ